MGHAVFPTGEVIAFNTRKTASFFSSTIASYFRLTLWYRQARTRPNVLFPVLFFPATTVMPSMDKEAFLNRPIFCKTIFIIDFGSTNIDYFSF